MILLQFDLPLIIYDKVLDGGKRDKKISMKCKKKLVVKVLWLKNQSSDLHIA